MLKERIRKLNKFKIDDGAIVYWMDRERRVSDNWALICAQKMAENLSKELVVIYVLPNEYLNSAHRNHLFMIDALIEIEQKLLSKKIKFKVILGDPESEVLKFINQYKIGSLVTDFSPLKTPRSWREKILKEIKIAFFEVDSRNIIPCWIASNKQEFGAYTIRPKIKNLLDQYLDLFPEINSNKINSDIKLSKNNWNEIKNYVGGIKNIPLLKNFKGGELAAKKVLNYFFKNKLKNYSEKRNDPTQEQISNLSPYLHFGMISSQRIALEIKNIDAPQIDKDDFLEELIIRRELSDNYCFYNKDYDNPNGFPNWAKQTIEIHKNDKREYIYSLEEFESAKTHDPLWNAAQNEMLITGKMHGYMRMYWCKKILEWTKCVAEAQKIAIELNDKYELDGRDSNGYTGIAWSLGGVHDRAWFEREVFGKIRYMNFNGCKRKFDIQKYINKFSSEYR